MVPSSRQLGGRAFSLVVPRWVGDHSKMGKTGFGSFWWCPSRCGGTVLALFSGPLGIVDSNVAEVRAIEFALSLYVESPWRSGKALIVDSESLVALGWITQHSRPPWQLWEAFVHIDLLCAYLSNVCFAHAYCHTPRTSSPRTCGLRRASTQMLA
ncbi:hypothetical protein GQ457_11G028230 [Hibiscus cannabinus]